MGPPLRVQRQHEALEQQLEGAEERARVAADEHDGCGGGGRRSARVALFSLCSRRRGRAALRRRRREVRAVERRIRRGDADERRLPEGDAGREPPHRRLPSLENGTIAAPDFEGIIEGQEAHDMG